MKEENLRKRTPGANDSTTTTTTTTTSTTSKPPATAVGGVFDGVPAPEINTSRDKPSLNFVPPEYMVDIGEHGHLAPYGSLVKADNDYNNLVLFHKDFSASADDTVEVRRIKAAKKLLVANQAWRIVDLNLLNKYTCEAREHLKLCEKEAEREPTKEEAKLALGDAQAALLQQQNHLDAAWKEVKEGMVELRKFFANPQLLAEDAQLDQFDPPMVRLDPIFKIGYGALLGFCAGGGAIINWRSDRPVFDPGSNLIAGGFLASFLVMITLLVNFERILEWRLAGWGRRPRPGD